MNNNDNNMNEIKKILPILTLQEKNELLDELNVLIFKEKNTFFDENSDEFSSYQKDISEFLFYFYTTSPDIDTLTRLGMFKYGQNWSLNIEDTTHSIYFKNRKSFIVDSNSYRSPKIAAEKICEKYKYEKLKSYYSILTEPTTGRSLLFYFKNYSNRYQFQELVFQRLREIFDRVNMGTEIINNDRKIIVECIGSYKLHNHPIFKMNKQFRFINTLSRPIILARLE